MRACPQGALDYSCESSLSGPNLHCMRRGHLSRGLQVEFERMACGQDTDAGLSAAANILAHGAMLPCGQTVAKVQFVNQGKAEVA